MFSSPEDERLRTSLFRVGSLLCASLLCALLDLQDNLAQQNCKASASHRALSQSFARVSVSGRSRS